MSVSSRRVLSVIAACAAAIAVSACGSSSGTYAGPEPAPDSGTRTGVSQTANGSDGTGETSDEPTDTADAPTDTAGGAADTAEDAAASDGAGIDDASGGDETSGTATFTVTGDIQLSGTLTNVTCMEANADNYVAQGDADTAMGEVTVGAEIPSPHPHGDQQEGNSLLVGDTLYNRTSMGGKPLSGHRDGEKLTVTAKLVNFEDPFNPDLVDDHDQWRTVTVTSHWNCGGQLAKWDSVKTRLSALGALDGGADAHDHSPSTPAQSSITASTATTTTTSSSESAPPAAVVRLPAPQSGDHTVRLSGAVDKTLDMPTVVCTGDVLTATGPSGTSMTIGIDGPIMMLHLAGSPEVWRAGEHPDSEGAQAQSVDFPLSGTVTPYPGGVALSGVTLARADSAMAAPDPSTTATAKGGLACTVGALTP